MSDLEAGVGCRLVQRVEEEGWEMGLSRYTWDNQLRLREWLVPGMLLGGARADYQQLVGIKEAEELGNNLIGVANTREFGTESNHIVSTDSNAITESK